MKTSTSYSAMAIAALAFGLGLGAAPAWADTAAEAAEQQGTDAADEEGGTDAARDREIVVTARLRPERIQDVPFAITAVSQEEVLDRGASELRDLQFSIPGLNIVSLNQGADRIVLRGIDPGSGTGLPIVGIYVNDVGISVDQQQRDPPFPLVDIARVEVLRGPQGTTYGQGSVAGTVRYITEQPDLENVTGYALANVYSQRYGEVGYRGNVAVGVPLVKGKLGLRVVGGHERYAGWIDYTRAGIEDANRLDRTFVRGSLLLEPSPGGSISLMYQYLDQTADASNLSNIASNRVNSLLQTAGPTTDKSHLINLSVNVDLGSNITLTSATGYQHRNNVLTGVIPNPPIVITFDTVYEQVTQELRFSSTDQTAPITWVFGGWYRSFDSQVNRTATFGGVPFAGLSLRGDDPVDSESRAVFGDVTWKATPSLEISGGLRYYWDDRSNNGVTPAGVLPTRKAAFDAFSPRLNVLYRWSDDVSTYATVSKGFRSGGFNGGSGSAYGAEKVWSYEVGTKAALFDGALYFDLAAYYLDYKDRQSQGVVLINGVNFTETTNAGAASGPGIEGAMTIRLPAGFGIDLTAAYNDVEYDTTTQDTNAGEPFDYVPGFTASASIHQRIPFNVTTTGYWRADYQHADGAFSIVRANTCNPATGTCTPGATLENYQTSPQDIVNLRAGIEFGRFDVSLDVYNLFNEDAETFLFSPVAQFQQATRVRPRSFGLTVRARID